MTEMVVHRKTSEILSSPGADRAPVFHYTVVDCEETKMLRQAQHLQ